MKTIPGLAMLALLALSTLNSPLTTAQAQGTAFTYQGRLNDGTAPANGSYDLRFILYDNSVGGNQQGPILTNSATAVSNGLFIVTLDFGNQFPGTNRYLEIAVRTNGSGAFTTLSPRQALTPTPYAITAGNVVSGGLAAGSYSNAVTLNNAANQFTGTFTGNGSGLTNAGAATLGGLASSNFWQLGGNTVSAGQFLGSVNNQPVAILANNLQVMQFAYATNAVDGYSPNVIGGYSGNNVAGGVVGATIGGGGSATAFNPNMILGDFGTVVGGSVCVASKYAVAGGYFATAGGQYSVAFGKQPQATGYASAAMGGGYASGTNSTALGDSSAVGDYSTAMGYLSSAYGYASTAMGNSTASGQYSTAMGLSSATNDYATAMGYRPVAGGYASTAMGFEPIASGYASTAMGFFSLASEPWSTAMGASFATGTNSTAFGNSSASNSYATAMGKSTAGGQYSTAMGYSFATTNYASAMGQSYAYGQWSTAMGNSRTVGDGSTAMGYSEADGAASTAMGESTATGDYSVSMGYLSEADGLGSIAAGVGANATNGETFVWSDGSAFFSTGPNQFLIHATGGVGIGTNGPTAALHVASGGNYTFPQAQITQQNTSDGCRLRMNVSGHPFWEMQVTSDASAPQLLFYLSNQSGPRMYVTSSGALYAASFNNTSDRNLKENFSDVSPQEVLDKVAALPITRWNFKEDKTIEHLGPMAQDFHAAFGLGTDDKHIATVDEEGVALAAIQGLNEKLEQKLEQKETEITELKQNVAELKKMLQAIAEKK